MQYGVHQLFEEKDPILKPPDENATPAELRKLIALLQIRVVEVTKNLKIKNGEVREQRKDIRRKDVALAKKKPNKINNAKKVTKNHFSTL